MSYHDRAPRRSIPPRTALTVMRAAHSRMGSPNGDRGSVGLNEEWKKRHVIQKPREGIRREANLLPGSEGTGIGCDTDVMKLGPTGEISVIMQFRGLSLPNPFVRMPDPDSVVFSTQGNYRGREVPVHLAATDHHLGCVVQGGKDGSSLFQLEQDLPAEGSYDPGRMKVTQNGPVIVVILNSVEEKM